MYKFVDVQRRGKGWVSEVIRYRGGVLWDREFADRALRPTISLKSICNSRFWELSCRLIDCTVHGIEERKNGRLEP